MSILDARGVVRLYWDGRHGVVQWPDGFMSLPIKPHLGFSFWTMDYAPGMRHMQVSTDSLSEPRDMNEQERIACAWYVASVAGPPDVD